MNFLILILVFIIYLFLVVYVGYIAYKRTDSSEDYLLAGRNTHPYIMAISYGATFISTAAIVGFGGIAGKYGMSILWLAFLNLSVGIFIAFVFLGKRTRRMGVNLNSVTFPDFLSRRFNSRFLKIFSGLIIFLIMPLYSSVVLIGAARFIETSLNLDFYIALFLFSIIIAAYVFYGGIKGVMYTDALQGTIMFCGMIFLLIFVYWILGGVDHANNALTNMSSLYPKEALTQGGTGFTSFPTLFSPFWWYLVSTLIMGVGIGTIAQPQLIVRFMTVKSDRELNRSVLIGGIFIAIMPVTAYIVGSLSNVYFYQKLGKTAVEVVGGNIDKIIPTFIDMALPEWFVYIFLLTLLAAAMSTLSSLYHIQGTSFGSDIFSSIKNTKAEDLLGLTKIGILMAVIISLILSFILPASVIAVGTSLFMGICAASFLPVFIASIYWKRTTREGAIASIISGLLASLFCLLFMYDKSATTLGICKFIFAKPVLIQTMPWPYIDPLIFGVPVSIIFLIVVSLLTKPLDKDLVEKAFK